MEQIVGVLKQTEVGVPVAELIRRVGISEQTFHRMQAEILPACLDRIDLVRRAGMNLHFRSQGPASYF